MRVRVRVCAGQSQQAALRKVRLMSRISADERQRKMGLEKVHSKVCHAIKTRSLKHLHRVLESKPPPNLDECEKSTGFAALHYAAGR